jgi:hypothetical protein
MNMNGDEMVPNGAEYEYEWRRNGAEMVPNMPVNLVRSGRGVAQSDNVFLE